MTIYATSKDSRSWGISRVRLLQCLLLKWHAKEAESEAQSKNETSLELPGPFSSLWEKTAVLVGLG